MGEHFLKNLSNWGARLEGGKKEKRNIILAIGVSIFIMGVFFYTPSREVSEAKSLAAKAPESLKELMPEKKIGTFIYKDSKERKLNARLAEDASKRAGKAGKQADKAEKVCIPSKSVKAEAPSPKLGEKEVTTMVAGHPIEEMAPYISKRDKKVASFLVAIAKKESDWGTHSPLKYGRNCYNYWGYRGKENTTESGYSCFDNPEHAVQVVGDRIENLLNKKIDTPTKMVVWKCGRDCEAAGGQAAANKWISDVAHIYTKLNS